MAENQLVYHLYFNDRHYYCKPVKNILYAITGVVSCFVAVKLCQTRALSFIYYFYHHLCFLFFIEKFYRNKYGWYQFAVLALSILLLHVIFQFPSNSYNGYPRNIAAFYQHYMVNMFYLNKATEYDWIYWKDAHKAIFADNPNFSASFCIIQKSSLRIFCWIARITLSKSLPKISALFSHTFPAWTNYILVVHSPYLFLLYCSY